eukprot:CAMPEP_0172167568 /NCGR_PEP_ID=MMETSP1050-20130122/9652_1 /TAXON_ID=233186 /ORGANISM="Cryptomonas curvata, Strain CCAP979/52" /LENGTH=94 /DNA_ID=CAMNT_0012838389 /DNA_START=333 /DNA_END=613 /DNA_ORIENTATION=+
MLHMIEKTPPSATHGMMSGTVIGDPSVSVRSAKEGRDSRERRRRSRSRSPRERRHRDDSDKWESKRSDRYDDPPQRSRGYRDLDEQPYDHADRR